MSTEHITNDQAFNEHMAIILDDIQHLSLDDYVKAIAKKVQPENILLCDRMSNKVWIYLKDLCDVEFLAREKKISIEGYEICIRRLIEAPIKILLSNVLPSIPNYLLENKIRSLGFTTTSSMTFQNAEISGEEYGHMKSIRREIFIKPEEGKELPKSIEVTFEDKTHSIILSVDKKNEEQNTQLKDPKALENEERPQSSIPSTSKQNKILSSQKIPKIKINTKTNPSQIAVQKAIKRELQKNPDKYKRNFQQYFFLFEHYNIIEKFVKEYKDKEDLIIMLENIYEYCDKPLKRKITKILKELRK
ncbi:hypothetical protein WA026_004944 [Henosepilachna vigintioctopunctata]|uniref:Uncharacterized protein n=1 Tax=Henosepilachna vigintioctopunctata TaxID=420089 RepID=A0AAW1UWP6_9CUCU